MNGIGEERVREQLAKILASKEFENSERLCRFLQFGVEALLRGEQDQVKEYLIGKMVFDRNADYDPRIDPIVRVEARRLRKKLDDYYVGVGALDVVRIQVPKGSYVPEIQLVESSPGVPLLEESKGARGQSWKWIAIGLGCFVVIAVAGFLAWKPAAAVPQNAIGVIPARWLWANEDFPAIRHDEDLAERIATNLSKRHQKPVISWPTIQRYRGRTVESKAIAKDLGISRLLIVAVRVEADGLRVTTYLIDPNLGHKLKVSDKRSSALETPADREKAAALIAADFAGAP